MVNDNQRGPERAKSRKMHFAIDGCDNIINAR